MSEAEVRYRQALDKAALTTRDLDIDAFADGVLAHRNGVAFHENPHGTPPTPSISRLSWAMGWNERALQQ